MSSPSARDKPKSPIFTCRERIELFGLSDKYMYDIMPSESIAIYSNKKRSDLIVMKYLITKHVLMAELSPH